VAILSVAQSSALAAFVNIVLQVGNFLNDGTARKGVVGFDISFLPKLSYIKSGDLKTTLMRFILEFLTASPAYTGLVDAVLLDLQPCVYAARLSLHRMDASVAMLTSKLNVIKMTKMAVANRNKVVFCFVFLLLIYRIMYT
jgi:hypothetical protein